MTYDLCFDNLLHETDSAYLIEFEPEIQLWMPKSVCTLDTGNSMTCRAWFVEDKELEGYMI